MKEAFELYTHIKPTPKEKLNYNFNVSDY
jgi:hypothetical protein